MKTVVFLDLDGTFWNWGAVPPSAVEAIARAQANGHKVLTNTGRTCGETRDLSPYRLDGRCYGAGSEVILDGRHVVDEPLGAQTAHYLEFYLQGLGIAYLAEGSERCYKAIYKPEEVRLMEEELAFAWANGDPFLVCPDVSEMSEADYEQVYKFSVFSQEDTTPDTVPGLPEGFVFTPLGKGGEITRVGITKATALEAVRTALGGAQEWRTMALGDSNNDVPMLRAADVGVCMGNGNDAARAAADWVTSAIDEDGLAHAFEHFGLI